MSSSSSTTASTARPLLLLSGESRALLAELTKRLGEGGPPAPCDVRLLDYDGTQLRVDVPEGGAILRVGLTLPGWRDLVRAGAPAYLTEVYGGLLAPAPHDGCDVTLSVPTTPPPSPDLLVKLASLRRHAMAAPFVAAMRAVTAGTTSAAAAAPPVVLTFRPGEPTYIVPRSDRVTVIFAIEVTDPTDAAIARVIAQEFSEATRQVPNAPPASFADKEGAAPAELRGLLAGGARGAGFVGWLSFALLPAHFKEEARLQAVATQMSLLRPYLDYHIKAAKVYLHGRMRVSRGAGRLAWHVCAPHP